MIFALLLISPTCFTEPVEFDADDPAVLYNAAAPERSLIVGTDKEKAPGGGLYAFNLEGKVVGRFSGVDRPNNVDITTLSNGKTFVLTTERLKNRVRVFTLSFDGTFIDVTGDTEVSVEKPERIKHRWVLHASVPESLLRQKLVRLPSICKS